MMSENNSQNIKKPLIEDYNELTAMKTFQLILKKIFWRSKFRVWICDKKMLNSFESELKLSISLPTIIGVS